MDLTILNSQNIFSFDQLDFMGKRGLTAEISDFAILLGGFASVNLISEVETMNNKVGCYWIKPQDGQIDLTFANEEGRQVYEIAYSRHIGIRVAGNYSDISNTGEISGYHTAKDGILEIEYGYYPDNAVSVDMQEKLERLFQNGGLIKTKNCYTTDSRKDNQVKESFVPQVHVEYELDGKRYVRVPANFCSFAKTMKLSNGQTYDNGDPVWVEVSPITWLVDKKKDIIVTKKIVLAGIQMYSYKERLQKFEVSNIKRFIDDFFSKEITQDKLNCLTNKTMMAFSDYVTLKNGIKQMTLSQKCTFLAPFLELGEEQRTMINAFLSSLDSQLMFILENLRDESKKTKQEEKQKVFSKKNQ